MRPSTLACLAAALIAATGSVYAQMPFADGFERGTVQDYLETPGNARGITVAEADGTTGKCLQFARGVRGQFRLAKSAVIAETKYKLSFRGKLVGDDTIETNSRLDVIQVAAGHRLPGWQIHFFDADGKPLPKPLRGAMLSSQWRPYVSVFYPPPRAVAAQVAIDLPSDDYAVLIDAMQLDACPDEGAINCNPDFRYGPQAYTGWASLATGALLVEGGGGKRALDTAYGSSSEPFPLREPGTYRLAAKGTVHGGFHTVDLRLYDENGTLIKTRSLTATPAGASSDFVLPEGTVAGSLLVYNHLLEEVRLVRMGDKSKLAELDAARAAAKKQ